VTLSFFWDDVEVCKKALKVEVEVEVEIEVEVSIWFNSMIIDGTFLTAVKVID
jgi:hypothetical protein